MVSQQGGGGGIPYEEAMRRAKQASSAQLSDAFQIAYEDGAPKVTSPGNFDYLAAVKKMFAPQTTYLDQQAAQAQARGAQNQREVAGMYGQTVKDILGMAGGIKSNFGQGQREAGAAYNQALGSVNNAYDNSRDSQLAILRRLGIEQAAPEMLEQNAGDRAFIQSVMAANNQGQQNMLGGMKQSALTFNTEQGNITRQAGAEAQTGLRRGLEDVLSKIAGTRADLMGQMNKTAFDMQSNDARAAQEAQQDAYSRWKDERDFNYQMAQDKATLDLRRLGMAGQDEGATDPLGKVYSLANSVYGNPQSASNAVRLVSEAMGQGNPTTAAQFIQQVMDRAHRANANVNDEANLQRLAALMFSEMYGKQSPRPAF